MIGHEIALFWAVLAGLLIVDNCVLVPPGGDGLKFGRSWHLRYDLGLRIEVLRRDLVVLNPLNTFDRILLTTRSLGSVSAATLRSSVMIVRAGQPGANLLSWLGSGYLAALILLAAASPQVYFGFVLAVLALVHLLAWGACLVVLLRHRVRLGLATGRVFSLALEALLVPGYLVNLGKRVWFKRTVDLPALTMGLRQWTRMRDESSRELHRLRLERRIDEIALSLELNAQDRRWCEEARQCLKTSAPWDGS